MFHSQYGRMACVSFAFGVTLALHVLGQESNEHSTQHWPYTPVKQPTVPDVEADHWTVNEVDHFTLSELEKRGLEPNAEAEKGTLLRRLSLDLTGLPPSAEELKEFLEDDSPDAYEEVVDRLLASPRFGERWARHWLDVVRYSDTSGFKTDYLRPDAHRYRDYVIQSLNDDLPYDRFVEQQIAGDELEPTNPKARIATGMLRLYAEESTAADFLKQRQDVLDDVTDVTSLTFLGLTVACAKCHDHKFDPIEQKDFYRLESCFATMLPRDDVSALELDDLKEHQAQNATWEKATADVRRELDAIRKPILDATVDEITLAYDTDTRAAWLTPEDRRTTQQRMLVAFSERYINNIVNRRLRKLEGEAKQTYDRLQEKLATFADLKPTTPPQAMSVVNGPDPTPTYVLSAGDTRKHEEEVSPGFPAFLGPEGVPTPQALSPQGRRSALARWLTLPTHPLTARVIVNRVWQHHFGQGIVATPNDFGAMGDEASHPQLLDWLAAKLVADEWSLKSLHRLLVTSATYRQSSEVDPENPTDHQAMKVDPGNKLLWHARVTRLEGEPYRDSILYIAGSLNQSQFGPSSYPALPLSLTESSASAWQPDEVLGNRFRRSIYLLQKRNLRHPLLAALDQPDMYMSTGVRANSLTGTQSLTLLNCEETHDAARHWAGKLLKSTFGDEELISTAFREAYSRDPSPDELASSEKFLDAQTQRVYENESRMTDSTLPEPMPGCLEPHRATAYVDFCHALLNSSEFLWID